MSYGIIRNLNPIHLCLKGEQPFNRTMNIELPAAKRLEHTSTPYLSFLILFLTSCFGLVPL
jgi:hypothetical protein